MEGLLPNFALMAKPWNWFVVGFSVVLLLFFIHLTTQLISGKDTK